MSRAGKEQSATGIEIEEILRDVLRKHFPGALAEDIEAHSEDIYSYWSTALTLQTIERNNIRGGIDIKNLDQAARHLKRASASLKKVGWHGGTALRSSAAHYIEETMPKLPPNRRALVTRAEAANIVRARIDELADALSDAAEQIDPDAPSVLEHFGEDFRHGRPNETAAFFAVSKCSDTFKSLSGKKPTRVTSFVTSETTAPGGPFFKFVSEVFIALGVDTKVEHAIKTVLKSIAT